MRTEEHWLEKALKHSPDATENQQTPSEQSKDVKETRRNRTINEDK